MWTSSRNRPGRAGRMVLFALTIVAASSGAAAAWWWKNGRPMREARAAYGANDYELALRWVNWHLRISPNDVNGIRLRARCLARQGDYARAEPLFQQIPQLEAEDHFLLGLGYFRTHKALKAIEQLRKSIELNPTAEARRALAVAYNEVDRIDLALEQAKLLSEDPKEADLGLALLGELYYARQLPRASYDAFDKLLARNPDLKGVPQTRYGVLLNQIDSLLKLGEPEKAAALVDQLGDLDQDLRGLVLRGHLRQQQGDLQSAERDWKRVLELDPQNSIIVDLGLLTLERGNDEDAVRLLLRAAELYPSDPAIQQHLASAYHRLGNTSAAAEHQRVAKRLRDEMEQKMIRGDGSRPKPEEPAKNL
jgi:tetratricopeptide (TPR) repeat protein